MLRLGEKQVLEIVKTVDFGVYLAQDQEHKEERVLLPAKQVPEGSRIGDRLEVFLYKDSGDRLIATTQTPALTLGQVALLKVAQVGKIGAFLNWGLEKDLLLPFKQQTGKVQEGDSVLVSMYIDKSSRLCATMKIYHLLRNDSRYQKDDIVTGRVYEISERFGAFVAVDDCYSALIPAREMFGDLKVGQEIKARVTKVLEDGRLNLSVRQKAYLQMPEDADKILKLMERYDGSLPFTDKASPELIKEKTGMSKNEFKRAVGNLLKAGKIEILAESIRKR